MQMNSLAIDTIDLHILQSLIEDSARSHKTIGQEVHLSGQAVGARVRKLEELGIIEGYTIKWNREKIGKTVNAMITVFMKSTTTHSLFQTFVKRDHRIEEAHRVSGEGCYWLRLRVDNNLELNQFLDDLLQYGNYKVSLSIGSIKS
jgi:Lrp/AsnC family leucine-responsive transcriptional regulator